MSDALPVSVHILTRNAGATLRRALQSLPSCQEILIVDGGSTDDTLAIAREYGARILTEKRPSGGLPDFSELRNIALRETSQPWILVLDSDETLSPSLRDEIIGIARSASPAAYLVPRKYVDAERRVIEFASTYPNERIYFFHRSVAEAWIKPVHERLQVRPNTTIRRLSDSCLAPLPTIEEFKEKNRRYLAIEAETSRRDGWSIWFRRRLLHTLRSRCIALLRLARIWLLPHAGRRLPLRHEGLRFWYAWRLIVDTCPARRDLRHVA